MRERVLYVHTLGGRHRWVSMICSGSVGGLHRKMQCLVLFFYEIQGQLRKQVSTCMWPNNFAHYWFM